ncbi:MAG: zf-TFIIB domain-containing protein [Sedimentisphaerales bacterium]
MNCPVCKNAMIVLELEQVEIDHCTACGGIWLDSGELELLLGEGAGLIGSFQPVDVKEKARRCPICLKKMQKIHAGSVDEPVIIDRCRKSHGLWFDKDELPLVLAKGSLDKEQKIIKLLSQIFSKESEAKNVS